MRPACVQCQCEMRCSKTGATIVVMSGGEPYQLWQADIFQCPGCGFEAVTGWASKPIRHSGQEDFKVYLERYLEDEKQNGRTEYVHEKPTPKKTASFASAFHGGKLAEKKEGGI